MKQISLLPNGFYDLLPDRAECEAGAIQKLIDVFGRFGYRRIKPPIAEFEDTLLAEGPGAAMARDTFRITDTVTHKMMAVRSDMTPQIARIIATRLHEEPRPVRLCYANDVIRARAGQLRTARQFTQVGCEMAGQIDPSSFSEIIMVALHGLKSVGIANITLDFSLPLIFEVLEQECDEERYEAFEKILKDRDWSALKHSDDPLKKMLLLLMEATGPLQDGLEKLKTAEFSAEIKAQIELLKQVHALIVDALSESGIKDVNISFDPFETKGSGYYRGLAFSLFARDVRGELGRGGHYEVRYGEIDTGMSAAGFTLYMDTVLDGVKPFQKKRLLGVMPGYNWQDVLSNQEEGWTTLFIRKETEAAEQGCEAILINRKIKTIGKG